MNTVNIQIFVRVLFLQNFMDAKFCENKILAKSLCCLLMQVKNALVPIFNMAIMSFNPIHENEILAKIT